MGSLAMHKENNSIFPATKGEKKERGKKRGKERPAWETTPREKRGKNTVLFLSYLKKGAGY